MYLRKLHIAFIIPIIINWYLILKIIFGQHGIVANKQQEITFQTNKTVHKEIKEKNDKNAIKASLINEDVINLRYLHELLRLQYSVIMPNEKVIILDKTEKKS